MQRQRAKKASAQSVVAATVMAVTAASAMVIVLSVLSARQISHPSPLCMMVVLMPLQFKPSL
jgi:hypothetical protein